MIDPLPTSKYAADAQDVSFSSQESVDVEVTLNGVAMLSEHYSPDAEGRIRLRGLADLFSTALYGELAMGTQAHATGDFVISVGDSQEWQKTVYSLLLRNPHDPDGQKTVMAVARQTVCHPGTPMPLTFTTLVEVTLKDHAGNTLGTVQKGSRYGVVTDDCDPQVLFPDLWQQGALMTVGTEMTVRLLPPRCRDSVVVMFLNRYDMPETVVAEYMEEKPSAEDSAALMDGRRTRFGVRNTTEYTLHSGRLHYDDQQDTWHDLLTARKARVLSDGRWTDIIVTKGNWTRRRRTHYGTEMQLSFQTASPMEVI